MNIKKKFGEDVYHIKEHGFIDDVEAWVIKFIWVVNFILNQFHENFVIYQDNNYIHYTI